MSKLKVEIEVNIPIWTNWIAVDESGDVYAYENEPRKEYDSWDVNLKKHGELKFLYKDKPPKNWKDELYTWG